MKPTNTAYAVVDTLEKYASAITKPEMTQTLENDMTSISERKIKEAEVIDESRDMLTSIFRDLEENEEVIGTSLREGLRTDKIVGKCEKCGSELIIRRGRRGSRFIGCSGYPNCKFTLPLPRFGTLLVTDKECDMHHMNHVRIINKGKRPWDLGCPHCNFLEWQAKKAKEPKPINDGLTNIQGIGPKTLEKLTVVGIKTTQDLLNAEVESLVEKTGLSQKKILAWRIAAKALTAPGC
jgi:DNA topoisomerase-1